MRAASLDLRERVLAAVDGGTHRAAIATTFHVRERTRARWVVRRQQGRPLVGGTRPGPPAWHSGYRAAWLTRPRTNATRRHLSGTSCRLECTAYARQPIGSGPCAEACRLDAQKTTRYAREQDPAARHAVRARCATVAADDIIVSDAWGSNRTLTPRDARAPCAQRAIGYVPPNTLPPPTLIASLTLDGLGPALHLAGAPDRLAFDAYVEHFLVPTLRPGQIVIRATGSAQRGRRVQQLIAARQCERWCLPSYSADRAPSEPAVATLKQAWRQAGARTLDAVYATISTSLPSITGADAQHCFTHCGYQPARTS